MSCTARGVMPGCEGVPIMVCVFPEPVWPYAKIVELYLLFRRASIRYRRGVPHKRFGEKMGTSEPSGSMDRLGEKRRLLSNPQQRANKDSSKGFDRQTYRIDIRTDRQKQIQTCRQIRQHQQTRRQTGRYHILIYFLKATYNSRSRVSRPDAHRTAHPSRPTSPVRFSAQEPTHTHTYLQTQNTPLY